MIRFVPILLLTFGLYSCSSDQGGNKVGEVCESNSECGSGLECEAGICVVHVHGASCGQHADCKSGEKCIEGECLTEERIEKPIKGHQHACEKDSECEHGTCEEGVCDEYKACESEKDCEPGEECTHGECAPMRSVASDGCQEDADCPGGQKCDWKAECCDAKNQCKPFGAGECKVTKDCPSGEVCFESVCYQGDITYTKDIAKLYEHYCVGCHGDKVTEGGWKWNDYDSLVADSYSCPGYSKAECTLIRLRNKSLPTGGEKSEEFTAADVGLLVSWIAGGMQK